MPLLKLCDRLKKCDFEKQQRTGAENVVEDMLSYIKKADYQLN